LRDQLELLAEHDRKPGGTSIAVLVSLLLHSAFLVLLAIYKPQVAAKPKEELVRFVEILRRQQPEFTEAPGRETDSARVDAPYSNANRRASMPEPTGEQPTLRPGDGSRLYEPGDPRPRSPQTSAPRREQVAPRDAASPRDQAQQRQTEDFAYQVPANRANAEAGTINWNSAIREVGKVASLGGDGVGAPGGDPGFAESGPISFESQWYEWGDYAQHMVARIRHHWYSNMPSLIRLGVRGVVTIQFTIQRSGAITDVRIVSSSEIPPFDFAAKQAIELSSPLNPLPADFPNSSERVTAQFYYNMNPPVRR
jgi:TonB family protein